MAHDRRFFAVFRFLSCRSPLLGAGGDLGNLATPIGVAQNFVTPCLIFFGGITSPRPPSLRLWRYFGLPLFRRHILAPPPLSGDMAVVFLDVFLPLTDRPPLFSFFLGVSCRLRSLAVQRCENGVLKSRIFDSCSSSWNRVPMTFPYFCIYGSSEWLV